ncbi:MAG TPA: hypothetical protein VN282_27495, partial [Pyrinomonadaceae bacterium]|nr:hypothetical protein [Pyrinomonadaceae bacterium]
MATTFTGENEKTVQTEAVIEVTSARRRGGRGRGGRGGGKGKRISELLKSNQEILVQAIKDPLKTKG